MTFSKNVDGLCRNDSQNQYISGKFSQHASMINDTYQDEPEDPDAVRASVANKEEWAAVEAEYFSPRESLSRSKSKLFGRNSRPSAHLHFATQIRTDLERNG